MQPRITGNMWCSILGFYDFGASFRFTFLLTPVWWDEGSSENLTSWIWFQGMILGFVDFSLKMRDKTRCVQVYGWNYGWN